MTSPPMARREAGAPGAAGQPKVHVLAGDWGMVTAQLTEAYGVVFAVLNMVGCGKLFLKFCEPCLLPRSRLHSGL